MKDSVVPSIVIGGTCLLLTLATVGSLRGEAEYPPGTVQLTPRVDLQLQPVQVRVPEQFSDVPRDLSLNLPPGFSATIFAAYDFVQPRFMAVSPDGVLHVSDMRAKTIVALPDRDDDGVADEAVVVARGFERAHSLAFYKGAMYVADTRRIVRLTDVDGDGVYEERENLVPSLPQGGWHSTRTILFDDLHEKFYVGVGWPCDMCRHPDPERGAVLQFNADGRGRRVFARGIRNPIGLALHPITNQLWATNNGHDTEGTSLPPEWIDIIRDGGFYGVPLAYGYQVYVDFNLPRYRENLPLSTQDSSLVESMERPVALIPAHLAPMGIHFYIHDQFPPQYRGAAFIALHAGHAKLAPVPGYSVVALFSDPDGSNARIGDFATGFQTGTEVSDVWGFPVGVIADGQGNLYVSSDRQVRAILRIEHSPIIASWEHTLPKAVTRGTALEVEATVHLGRLAPDGEAPVVTADLSSLGGPRAEPLEETGNDTYRLRSSLAVDVPPGLKAASVRVEQRAGAQTHVVRLPATVAVEPDGAVPDLVIYDETLADGWTAENGTWLTDFNLDLTAEKVVFRGDRAATFPVQYEDWDWVVKFLPDRPLDPVGYDRVRFAFHPGDSMLRGQPRFSIYLAETLIDLVAEGLLEVEAPQPGSHRLGEDRWQVVEVPLDAFGAHKEILEVAFSGNFRGRFYIDDLRLLGASPATAVEEEGLPSVFALEQNFPNPFNSDTLIGFTLPDRGAATLTIYNLLGQRVARLVEGEGNAGVHSIHWDGRDDRGRDVATGVYLYRLESATHVQTRKLVLLR